MNFDEKKFSSTFPNCKMLSDGRRMAVLLPHFSFIGPKSEEKQDVLFVFKETHNPRGYPTMLYFEKNILWANHLNWQTNSPVRFFDRLWVYYSYKVPTNLSIHDQLLIFLNNIFKYT